jgi:UDP-glucose 4-epimerase
MNMHQAILVFGGTGFIGSALVKILLSKKITVLVFRHKSTGFLSEIENRSLVFFDSFEDEVLRKYEILTAYHLASQQTAGKSLYNDFHNGNVTPTVKIVELLKNIPIRHLVYVSTTSVFFKSEYCLPMSEGTTPNPTNYYGLTKYISERILAIECKEIDVKISIVRLPSVFGVNSGGGLIETLYQESIRDKDIEVFSNGQRFRNIMHVDSVVELLYLFMKSYEKLEKFEIFMGGSKDSEKLINIAKKIVILTNSNSKIIPIDRSPPLDIDVCVDISKAKKVLGFKPMSIEDGLKKYIEEEYEKI